MQEVITLVTFCVFSVTYLKEELRWNYLVGFGLMIAAVFFVFKMMRETQAWAKTLSWVFRYA